MKRFSLIAALAVAALFGGANKASADFTIQLNGLNLVNGSTGASDPLDFLKIGNTVLASPTAIGNFTNGVSTLTFNGTGFSPAATFTFPTTTITTNGKGGATIADTTTNFTINAALIPADQGTLVSATLSMTDPVNSGVFTGNFGGSIMVFTTRSQAIPEPASMAMLAMGGLGVVGAARRRRKV